MTNKSLAYARFQFGFLSAMARNNFHSFYTDERINEFSSRVCDMCGSTLAGERYAGTGLVKSLVSDTVSGYSEFQVCLDCVYFAEYGKLDDMTMLEVDEKETRDWLYLLCQDIQIKKVNPYILDFYLPYKDVFYILRIEDIISPDEDGKAQVCYNLYDNSWKVIFNGSDIFLGSGQKVLTPDTFQSVLGWLTLRLGDTDGEYFDKYTEAQIEFRDNVAEYFGLFALEYSEKEKAAYIQDYFEGLRESTC